MKIVLEVLLNTGEFLRRLELGAGAHGVGSSECSVQLSYPSVSRKHAEITVEESTVLFSDLGSKNGSRLGANLVVPNESLRWESGAPITIGPFLLSWKPCLAHNEASLLHYGELYSRWLAENPELSLEKIQERLCSQIQRQEAHPERLLEELRHEFHGAGPIREALADPDCREILINAFDEIFIDFGLGLARTALRFLSSDTFNAWATRTALSCGRRLDPQHPICEATLRDGARFHAVLPPLSARGLCVAIRRFGSAPQTEESALQSQWLDAKALETLKAAVREKRNIVISGGTSTGKTSLLNFLCHYLSADERVVTIEDTKELSPPVANLIQLQARKANADGVGAITLRQLIQCSLRLRPDRILVGECRGDEVLEMLQALNTGHPGSLTTVHANSPQEALARLELLALLGAPNLSIGAIRQWIHSTIELIAHVERDASGKRHVSVIAQRKGARFETCYHRQMAPSAHPMVPNATALDSAASAARNSTFAPVRINHHSSAS